MKLYDTIKGDEDKIINFKEIKSIVNEGDNDNTLFKC